MTKIRTRRGLALIVAAASISLVGAACTTGGGGFGYGGPPVVSSTFRATSLTAVDQTEYVWTLFCVNCYDEPYLVNIHFRVAFNSPNSASAGVVSTRSFSPEPEVCAVIHQNQGCNTGDETITLTAGPGGSGAQSTDSNIPVLDLWDVANGQNQLVVVGNWIWAMEEDLIGNPLPGTLANTLTTLLNSTIAAGVVPDFNDGQAIVDLILGNLGNAISLGGAALANLLVGLLPFAGDDLVGSKMYIRVGAYGAIGALIDAANVNVGGINLSLSAIGIPNISGAAVRSMASAHNYPNEVYQGSGADYRISFTDG